MPRLRYRAKDLYHASATKLDVGTILEPRALNLLDDDIEHAIEAMRPPDRLARTNAVYAATSIHDLESLVTRPDYLYRVEIEGIASAHDHTFASQIWRLFAGHENNMTSAINARIKTLARFYWSGVRSNYDRYDPPMPEILCQRARIVEAF